MQDFKLVPGGRILAVRKGFDVTFIIVLFYKPADSRMEILDNLKP